MRNTLFNAETGCWTVPDRSTDKDGYTVFRYKGRATRLHRVAYIESFGSIPKGAYVCHTCDNPSCFNPDHLFLGSPMANMRDKVNKNRQHKPTGELNGQALLTEDKVREIKELLQNSELTQTEVGVQFGVSRQCISGINIGRLWRHVS